MRGFGLKCRENRLMEQTRGSLVSNITNFRHVVNVVFFLMDDSLTSEFYVPTFWNTMSIPPS
jgi:hypothetical protein